MPTDPTCARDGCPTPCTVELVTIVARCPVCCIPDADVVIAYACQLPHLTAVMFATRHLGEARRIQTLGGKHERERNPIPGPTPPRAGEDAPLSIPRKEKPHDHA